MNQNSLCAHITTEIFLYTNIIFKQKLSVKIE